MVRVLAWLIVRLPALHEAVRQAERRRARAAAWAMHRRTGDRFWRDLAESL
jgi:hypothetical protein